MKQNHQWVPTRGGEKSRAVYLLMSTESESLSSLFTAGHAGPTTNQVPSVYSSCCKIFFKAFLLFCSENDDNCILDSISRLVCYILNYNIVRTFAYANSIARACFIFPLSTLRTSINYASSSCELSNPPKTSPECTITQQYTIKR